MDTLTAEVATTKMKAYFLFFWMFLSKGRGILAEYNLPHTHMHILQNNIIKQFIRVRVISVNEQIPEAIIENIHKFDYKKIKIFYLTETL